MPETALEGVRVLEVGNFMAAPFCAMQLADLGAEVVKIENPDGGDHVRTTAPFLAGESANYAPLTRNTRPPAPTSAPPPRASAASRRTSSASTATSAPWRSTSRRRAERTCFADSRSA